MRRLPRLLLLLALLPIGRPALAVRRETLRQLRDDYAGHTFRLRTDLRGTNYLVISNVVDEKGIRYRGRELPILFRQMETVYLDRISNEREKSVTLTLYRSRDDARQIRGAIPAAPLPVGPDRNTTLGNFARDLSTSVTLEIAAGKDNPDAQREQVTTLLNRLFYLKEEPTYEEKEAFIRSHRDFPAARLAQVTGLDEAVIRGILDGKDDR